MIADALARRGDSEQAYNHAQRACALDPTNAHAQALCGTLAAKAGRLDHALACFKLATQIEPENPGAWSNLGAAFAHTGRLAAAVAAFERAVVLSPEHPFLRAQLADTCLSAGDFAQAVVNFRTAAHLAPEDPGFRIALANAHQLAGDPERALVVLEEVMAMGADNARIHAMAGDLHVALGDFAAAANSYGAALSGEAGHVDALIGLSRLPAEMSGPDLRGQIEACLTDSALTEDGRIGLLFALGNLLDQAGAPEQAIVRFQEANGRLRARMPSDLKATRDAVVRTGACFTAELLRRGRSAVRSPCPLPIFIFGMPRSGTTLVERIIAAHPRARAGGELPYVQQLVQDWPDLMQGVRGYPEGIADSGPEEWERLGQRYLDKVAALAGGAASVTDKNPFNFMLLGFISLILPGAKLIHCTRDPMDVCASNFITYYARGQAAFSYDFGSLVKYHRLYEQLMGHWQAILPVPMLEMSYERLVGDLEGESRRLLEFCGLPWDARVLDFHTRAGAVGTASSVQVRQPVHGRSVGRWRRYGSALAPLHELLRER